MAFALSYIGNTQVFGTCKSCSTQEGATISLFSSADRATDLYSVGRGFDPYKRLKYCFGDEREGYSC